MISTSAIGKNRVGYAALKWTLFASFYLALFFTFFFFSLHIFYHYYLGDQLHYNNFWDVVSQNQIGDISSLQLFYTGSIEPGFGLVVWSGTQIFDRKEIFFSIINGLFAVQIFVILRNYKVPLLVTFST